MLKNLFLAGFINWYVIGIAVASRILEFLKITLAQLSAIFCDIKDHDKAITAI